ncbi:hypothetical protein F3Y22_tig00109923pilonHSYRG00045 [Hibiscus syriacus]|uniref:Reverse transcriptase/retrotransposon-derived protein RNase H-like domain-containing protein n=1 Tax=Hibiscus syriacus TaxID=106335 RepID=A0A6A3BTL3_HIBSY|nr:hypothetical protein F3Y22_tig00109923pilonHSYRG00045 [Hibiscus syriacus]
MTSFRWIDIFILLERSKPTTKSFPGFHYSGGRTSGFMIVSAAPVSIKAITEIGFSYFPRCLWIALCTNSGIEAKMIFLLVRAAFSFEKLFSFKSFDIIWVSKKTIVHYSDDCCEILLNKKLYLISLGYGHPPISENSSESRYKFCEDIIVIVTGHSPFDMDCSCKSCRQADLALWLEGNSHSSYNPHKKMNKKIKSSHSDLYQRYMQEIPLLDPWEKTMEKFPPLEEFTKTNYRHTPKIQNLLAGENISAAEATLNWQSKNALAQNSTLKKIDSKISQMDSKLSQILSKVDANTKIANELIVLLHRRLQQVERQTTSPGQDLFLHFEQKEKEIQKLKEHIRILEETGQVPQPQKEYEHFSLFGRTGPEPQSFLYSRQPKEYQEAVIPKIATVSHQEATSEEVSDNESSESSYASSDDLIMATTNQPEEKSDVSESGSPMDAETSTARQPSAKLTRDSNYDILTEFVSRFTGVLRDRATEQFVTLEIPSDFPGIWMEVGYSHIHFGVIRLALNYHGTEGKPVVARIALLDTRYLKYQDACIGTVEATMNNGLVMVTLFPNFTMALADPNLMDVLKVQIHIVGAPQIKSSIIATLHYQIVYRIQDHAFKFNGSGTGDSLLISVNTQEQPHCVHIHEKNQPIRSTNNQILSREGRATEIRFDHSHLKGPATPSVFPTQLMMLPTGDPREAHDKDDPDCYCDLCKPSFESQYVEKFDPAGRPIYMQRDPVIDHSPFDMDCSCKSCRQADLASWLEGNSHSSYNPHKKMNKKKKSSHSDLYQRYMQGDPSVGPLGEDNGKYQFLVDYSSKIPSMKNQNQTFQPSPHPKPPPNSKYQEAVIPKIAAVSYQEATSEEVSDNESSESSYASSDDLIMATTNQPEEKSDVSESGSPMDAETSTARQPSAVGGGRYVFTLDDILVSRWSQRFQEFHSWMETQKLTRDSNYDILTEFVSRFTRVLRDWWMPIPQGDQMQFLVQQDFATVIRVMHNCFLGNPDDIKTLKRKEFFKRKCCSYKKKDLETHFSIMTKLFYALGAEPSLKHGILASIPELQIRHLPHTHQQAYNYSILSRMCGNNHSSRLYLLETKQRINGVVEELKVKACAESHEEFLSKCDHPLWRNSEFFIQLPFKKNEDINPTKASHSGMNPEHQKLAESECVDLLQQGLIEPSDSQWACEAFYVNKRSEQARGKLRLVINYQPLNQFLQDDKFPLPNRNALFLSLARAQIFSKFDLKSGPHIAQELLKFPEKDFTKKQILQLLGIVNYLRDFIPKISKYTNPMRKMLKKDPPPWKDVQTKAVKVLKEKLQQLPPLQIPSDGKMILQTDASDKYWGAVQLEEKDQKRYVCGYKSGRFSDAEIHYHSTFKEILVVKKGITKFEFHLIGYHFLVEMDMSSFPQMLKFKQKVIPNPQLLRWAEWFSKYSFDCKHIKGKTNVLADLLSRPPQNQIHKIMMYRASSSSSSKPPKKPKTQPEKAFSIPPNLNPEFPPEVYRLVIEGTFHSKARDMIFEYQLELFRFYRGLFLKPHGLHPDYPFIHPIPFEFTEVPDELKWLLWYFTHIHHVAIQFHLEDLQYFLDKAIRGKAQPELSWIHRIYPDDVRNLNQQYRDLQRYLCQINRQIPIEVWPPPNVDAPWDTWPSDSSLLTPYYKSIMEALKAFKEMVLDPSEWSQEYPWINSVASKRGESSQPPEHPLSKQTDPVPAPENDKMEMDPEAWHEAYQLECYRRNQEKEDRIIELNITSDESTDYSNISL